MYCTQTLAGIPSSCEGSKGGVKRVLIGLYQEDAFTVTSGAVSEVSSAITFYDYSFKPQTSNMTGAGVYDPQNGVSFVETTVNLVFPKMDTQKRIEMNALSKADLVAIVIDSNNEWWALGTEEPVVATASTNETGTAKTDGNKYTIALKDSCNDFPPALTEAAKASIVIAD